MKKGGGIILIHAYIIPGDILIYKLWARLFNLGWTPKFENHGGN